MALAMAWTPTRLPTSPTQEPRAPSTRTEWIRQAGEGRDRADSQPYSQVQPTGRTHPALQPRAVAGFELIQHIFIGHQSPKRLVPGLGGSAPPPLQFGLQRPHVGIDLLDQIETPARPDLQLAFDARQRVFTRHGCPAAAP